MKLKIKSSQQAEQPITKKELLNMELVPMADLKIWKDNPRKNDEAAKKLAPVLRKHGQISPIVVWRKNMVIYKGNTTFKAMKINGDKSIKAIFRDFPSEEAAVAYGIADNRASEFSFWDGELLERMLESKELDREALGFNRKELQSILLIPDLEIHDKIVSEMGKVFNHIIIIKCMADHSERVREVIEKALEPFSQEVIIK